MSQVTVSNGDAVQRELSRLNDVLNDYAEVSKLTVDEVLEKKSRDLGIKIWQGFWALRVRMSRALQSQSSKRAAFSGPLFNDAAARNWRVRVRETVLVGAYAEIHKQGYRIVKRDGPKEKYLRRDKLVRPNKRALLVAQELATRQSGAGILGVSFLFKRWRRRKTVSGKIEKYLIQNKSGKLGILSSLEKGEDAQGPFVKINNRTPGVTLMDGRKSIIHRAMLQVRQDTMVYLLRKQMQNTKGVIKKVDRTVF